MRVNFRNLYRFVLECNIDVLNAIRNDFKANGIKISLNDLILKAAATALQLVPEVNINAIGEDDYQLMSNIDISVAVATPNGLITPIVTDVVGKSLPEVANTVRDLALRARDGKLQLNEFQVNLKFFLFEIENDFQSLHFLLGWNLHNFKSRNVWY